MPHRVLALLFENLNSLKRIQFSAVSFLTAMVPLRFIFFIIIHEVTGEVKCGVEYFHVSHPHYVHKLFILLETSFAFSV